MKDTKKKVQWILNELELHIEAISINSIGEN